MLRLIDVVKNYDVTKELSVHALKGITLNFRKTEFVSVLGASGCGKTTLLNIIGGLDRYTSGDIKISGVSTKNYSEKDWNAYRNDKIGFVFQSYNLIPHQTVVENVELALTLSGVSSSVRRQKALKALEDVGLKDEVYKKPNQLSGGQMQRVALARALVNDPEIVLADEPTGALDSVTSVQVLDLLKKVAEDRLVIMVTHNGELAEKYSTRIIRLKDGEVLSDSNPYSDEQQQADVATDRAAEQETKDEETTAAEETENNAAAEKAPKQKKKRVRMSFFTALALSFKNLLTKKGRTLMTSAAGSIGIIGVALVLALSNGFNLYMEKMERDTLSGYPITIAPHTVDPDQIYEQLGTGNANKLPLFPKNDNNVHVYDSTQTGIKTVYHYNYIDQNYFDYIEQLRLSDAAKEKEDRLTSDIRYGYRFNLNVFTQYNGRFAWSKTSYSTGITSQFTGSDGIFQEALSNDEFVKSQYDVLYGKYPEQSNQIAVIVDSRNRMTISTLGQLGIDYEKVDENTYKDIAFEDLLDKEFCLVYNDAYYIKNGADYVTLRKNTATMQNLWDNGGENVEKLQIVGVLRIKPDSPLSMYNAGLLYLPSLTQKVIEKSKNSQIAQDAKAAALQGKYYLPLANDTNTFRITEGAAGLLRVAQLSSYPEVTEQYAYDYTMEQFGASDLPNVIYIYPNNFDSKDELIRYLDNWKNTDAGKENKIIYTDATGIISSTMGQMINIISYVLVAFAAISLLVSSVMIGIITYTSVIERTKEIGVLRSLGASKTDVSNVFNAETFIIGLCSGVLGVLFTYILCVPLNKLLRSLAGEALMVDIAVLSPVAAIVLIAISCVLTLIGGSIPSRYAAKLDPVKALRSE